MPIVIYSGNNMDDRDIDDYVVYCDSIYTVFWETSKIEKIANFELLIDLDPYSVVIFDQHKIKKLRELCSLLMEFGFEDHVVSFLDDLIILCDRAGKTGIGLVSVGD